MFKWSHYVLYAFISIQSTKILYSFPLFTYFRWNNCTDRIESRHSCSDDSDQELAVIQKPSQGGPPSTAEQLDLLARISDCNSKSWLLLLKMACRLLTSTKAWSSLSGGGWNSSEAQPVSKRPLWGWLNIDEIGGWIEALFGGRLSRGSPITPLYQGQRIQDILFMKPQECNLHSK